MKVFVTGVAGQLGHDVVNELTKRGHQAVGSDIAPTLESCASYVPLDITDAAAVEQTIMQVQPDAIVHCAACTAVDAAEDEENQAKVRAINVDGTKHIADAAKKQMPRWSISAQTMCLTDRARLRGSRTAKSMHRSMYTDRVNWGRAGSGTDTGKVFYRSYRLGIWIKRKEFYQNHVAGSKKSPAGARGK